MHTEIIKAIRALAGEEADSVIEKVQGTKGAVMISLLGVSDEQDDQYISLDKVSYATVKNLLTDAVFGLLTDDEAKLSKLYIKKGE